MDSNSTWQNIYTSADNAHHNLMCRWMTLKLARFSSSKHEKVCSMSISEVGLLNGVDFKQTHNLDDKCGV